MISIMRLLEGKYDYGCVMARIEEEAARKLLEFNLRTIAEELLYEEEGHEYGREKQAHITLKYGLLQSYSPAEMKKLLRNVTPFDIEVKGISVFENEKFDVVKFDVEGKELRKINEILNMLPNHDEYGDEYRPHLTLAYLKKGLGARSTRKSKRVARIPVKMIEYSDRGVKSHYDL